MVIFSYLDNVYDSLYRVQSYYFLPELPNKLLKNTPFLHRQYACVQLFATYRIVPALVFEAGWILL